MRSAISSLHIEAKGALVFISMLIDIVDLLISVLQMLILVLFVLGLLIAFNVVSLQNEFVAGFWRGLNGVLEPVLRPIRRLLPNTGTIDFSPLVLVLGLMILRRFLAYLAMASVAGTL